MQTGGQDEPSTSLFGTFSNASENVRTDSYRANIVAVDMQ